MSTCAPTRNNRINLALATKFIQLIEELQPTSYSVLGHLDVSHITTKSSIEATGVARGMTFYNLLDFNKSYT